MLLTKEETEKVLIELKSKNKGFFKFQDLCENLKNSYEEKNNIKLNLEEEYIKKLRDDLKNNINLYCINSFIEKLNHYMEKELLMNQKNNVKP